MPRTPTISAASCFKLMYSKHKQTQYLNGKPHLPIDPSSKPMIHPMVSQRDSRPHFSCSSLAWPAAQWRRSWSVGHLPRSARNNPQMIHDAGIFVGFPGEFIRENILLKWMIGRYPHVRKPPFTYFYPKNE